MRQNLFFSLSLRAETLLKKRLYNRYFPVNFVKFLRTPFFQNTSARLLLLIERKGVQHETVVILIETETFRKEKYTTLQWEIFGNL